MLTCFSELLSLSWNHDSTRVTNSCDQKLHEINTDMNQSPGRILTHWPNSASCSASRCEALPSSASLRKTCCILEHTGHWNYLEVHLLRVDFVKKPIVPYCICSLRSACNEITVFTELLPNHWNPTQSSTYMSIMLSACTAFLHAYIHPEYTFKCKCAYIIIHMHYSTICQIHSNS